MATLTEASITARKSIRFTIYGIIGLIILRMLINTGVSIYKKIFPPPPEPANMAFGKLPKIKFPDNKKLNLTFSLETAEGSSLPTFPLKTNVYFMPKKSANLLSLDFAKDKAKKLGFNPEEYQTNDSTYQFRSRDSEAILEYDIITGAFSISYDLSADPSPLSVKPNLPEISLNTIKTFLSGASLMPEDLTGPTLHRYLKTQSGGFVEALSLSDSNLIRIDMFRKNYNNMPVVTATPREANVWFMLSGIREKGTDIIAGEYHYFPIDESKVATYPLKSADQIWNEFNQGNYYTATNGQTVDGESIKIRKIYLAYYDSGEYTEFLQPVFVLEGDKDFVAYIPALSSEVFSD